MVCSSNPLQKGLKLKTLSRLHWMKWELWACLVRLKSRCQKSWENSQLWKKSPYQHLIRSYSLEAIKSIKPTVGPAAGYLWWWRAPETTACWAPRWSHWSWAEIYPGPALPPCLLCCSLGQQVETDLIAVEAPPASEDTGHQYGCLCQCPLPHYSYLVCRHGEKDLTAQTGGQWHICVQYSSHWRGDGEKHLL